MAITGTDRGTGTNNASGTSFTLSPASNFNAGVGSWAVFVIAADNGATNGASNNINTVTDTLNNTWTKRQSPLFDNGAANAGVQGAFFTTPMNGGTLTTGTTITVTFGNNVAVAKAWALMEITPSAGATLEYVTGGVNTGSATANPTVTTTSITEGNIVIAGLFNEQGTTQVVTEDADTTNGTWSTQQTIDVGTTTSGMCVASQRKVVTATGTQTYNPTLLTSSDVILSWIELREVVAAVAGHGWWGTGYGW